MKKIKLKQIILTSIIILTSLIILKISTQKIDAKTYNELYAPKLISVGISSNDFGKLEYNEVNITSNSAMQIIDKQNNTLISSCEPNNILKVTILDNKFTISTDNNLIAQNIVGPIDFVSANNTPIQIVGLKRNGKQAAYKGSIQVIKAPTLNNLFSVVNILPLDDYLKGVVPNELPTSFGIEALKSQAIAARNYAIRPRIKTYPQFDICDSVSCQVYFGSNTEESLSNKAVEETKGLVGLYNDEIILALYSSTAGGYTESYENAFSDPIKGIFPANPLPYLKGKPDIDGMPILNNELAAREFYTSTPTCFDNNSNYYRWTKCWSKDELEVVLNKNLAKNSNSKFILPKFENSQTIGTLQKVEVTERGVSGKAMSIKITTSAGEWTIQKELLIRRIFENQGKSLPSANLILNNYYDSNGNLVSIEAIGGGLGHGVGLSQYGAGFMGKKGYTFDQILQHYYDGISIGTPPVVLNNYNNISRQEFYSEKGKADLIIDNTDNMKQIGVLINSSETIIPLTNFRDKKLRFKLDPYIKKGNNEIFFYLPKQEQFGKKIKAWLELYLKN